MKTSQVNIKIRYNNKLLNKWMIRHVIFYWLRRFVTWFDEKSGAVTPVSVEKSL